MARISTQLTATFSTYEMNMDILPKEFPELKESIYAGFFLRAKALFTDFVIYVPIWTIILILNKVEKNYIIYTSLFAYLFFIFYYVILVYKYEGSPGKRIAKIKIKKKNGKRIGIKEAVLREAVNFFLAGFLTVGYVMTAIKMPDGGYDSQIFESLKPSWYPYANWLHNIWIWSEIIIILLNKRKRALHDFIAGTVVIQDKFEEFADQWS